MQKKITKGFQENFLKEKPKLWIYQSIFEMIILTSMFTIISLLITHFWIDPIINPNPEIDLKCLRENNYSITLILNNPSSSPAEEVNIMLKTPWHGGGLNYPENELCNISIHPLLTDTVTKIFCKYIPPKSKSELRIDIENNSINDFGYSLWGKTTKKIDWASISCKKI